jgi:hypothetical protein
LPPGVNLGLDLVVLGLQRFIGVCTTWLVPNEGAEKDALQQDAFLDTVLHPWGLDAEVE